MGSLHEWDVFSAYKVKMKSKLDEHKNLIVEMYRQGNGAPEVNTILKTLGVAISDRQVQRYVAGLGISRTVGEALKARFGKMSEHPAKKFWREYKESRPIVKRAVSGKKRMQVLQRDKFKCRLCGATAKDTKLVIDHVVPVAGYTGKDANDISNLRTLCHECNMGLGKLHANSLVKSFKESTK